ncbi:MAG: hypothetical protein AAB370_01365 [Verrucomicrobiota bacterium]
MKALLAISLLLMTGEMLKAQTTAPNLKAMRSVSGQFNIYDQRVATSQRPSGKPSDQQLLDLEPSFLVVSCERIKQAINAELGAGRDWNGSIQVALRSARSDRDTAQIHVERLGARWNYRVEFPDRIARDQFTRTVVQVLLLELANRSASERSAEIPLWLSEGLTRQLLASHEAELILPPPTMSVGAMLVTPTHLQKRDPDSLEVARRVLRDQPALMLAELSWPETEKFSPQQAEVFQCSAQLLVSELIRLKGGRENLRTFIAKLAQFYNWQPAFLRAYQDHFPNQLALEKWWALQSAYFAGRDHQQLWTLEESAQKLEELLRASVAIRTTAGELPVRKDVSLQVVIREWDTPRQMTTLQAKLNELAQARRRVAPPFMTLVNDYATVLDDYMNKRKGSSATFSDFRSLPPSIQKVVLEALPQLDMLDARRAVILADNLPKTTAVIDRNSVLK